MQNLEAVIQKFIEQFAKKSQKLYYAKIQGACKKTPEIESLF